MHPELELFMSRLPTQVALEETPDGKHLLRGLPILRVGRWNGIDYSAADLQAMAANFAEIAQLESWQPPVRPMHQDDKVRDARSTLAWHQAVSFDATRDLLLTDLEIVDPQTVADLQSGKLRHISAEVWRTGYPAPSSGKEFQTPVLVGSAFVDDPAVKGMPWQIVVNAADYGHPKAEQKDGESMSWIESLKNVLRKEGVADEELSQIDTLAAAPPAPPDPKPETVTQTDPAIARQLEQLEQSRKEQAAVIEQLRAERAAERAKATVDGYVTGGILPPAVRVQALALVECLSALTSPIETLAAEGEGTRKVSAIDLLGEILGAAKPDLLTAPQSKLWQGAADGSEPETLSPEDAEKEADRIVGSK